MLGMSNTPVCMNSAVTSRFEYERLQDSYSEFRFLFYTIFRVQIILAFWSLWSGRMIVASISWRMPNISRKKSNFPPQLWRASVFPPRTVKPEIFPPTLKTVRFTSLAGFGRRFYYSNGGFATVTTVLSFSFLFISVESLKNYSKS
jgi:hypothetical protein